MFNLFAQAPAQQTQSIMIWAGVTLLVAMVLIVLGVIVYRRFNRNDGDDGSQVGFSLEDLRILHQQGQLSDDEFNRAREHLLAKFPTDSPPEQGPDNPAKPGITPSHD